MPLTGIPGPERFWWEFPPFPVFPGCPESVDFFLCSTWADGPGYEGPEFFIAGGRPMSERQRDISAVFPHHRNAAGSGNFCL